MSVVRGVLLSLAATLAVLGGVALSEGDWGNAALAGLLLARRWWWAPEVPAHVLAALSSRGGAVLREELLAAVGRALAQGQRWGVPPEAVALVLEEAARRLREGRAAGLFAGEQDGQTDGRRM